MRRNVRMIPVLIVALAPLGALQAWAQNPPDRSPAAVAARVLFLRQQRPRQPQVQNLDRAPAPVGRRPGTGRVGQQQVAGLDVPVHQPLLVQVLQPRGGLPDEATGLGHRQGALPGDQFIPTKSPVKATTAKLLMKRLRPKVETRVTISLLRVILSFPLSSL